MKTSASDKTAAILPLAKASLAIAIETNGADAVGMCLNMPYGRTKIPSKVNVWVWEALGFDTEKQDFLTKARADFQKAEQGVHQDEYDSLPATAKRTPGEHRVPVKDASKDAEFNEWPEEPLDAEPKEYCWANMIKFLAEVDPDCTWGGMARVRIDEENAIWVCDTCYAFIQQNPRATYSEVRNHFGLKPKETVQLPPVEWEPMKVLQLRRWITNEHVELVNSIAQQHESMRAVIDLSKADVQQIKRETNQIMTTLNDVHSALAMVRTTTKDTADRQKEFNNWCYGNCCCCLTACCCSSKPEKYT